MSNDTETPRASLIVFGTDDSGKPHASIFQATDIEAAKLAAAEMGMHGLRVNAGDHDDIVRALPAGRLFGSGKAFVPFVKVDLYDRIAALAGYPTAAEAGAAKLHVQASAAKALDPLDLWEALAVDQLVLAYDADEEAWYPAWINKITAKHILIQWRDYPDQEPVQIGIRDVGLPHPVHGKRKRQ